MALFNHSLLAVTTAKPPWVRPRESLFIDVEVNRKVVHVMVDTEPTHNFVMKEKAKELGLIFVTSNMTLKIINCLPTNVNGLTPRVSLTLGGWKKVTNFLVVPINVFDIVLGLDFWYEISAFILSHLNQLNIYDLGGSCIVPLIHMAQSGIHLFAMQFIKGFMKGKPIFLAAVREIIDNGGYKKVKDLPSCIQ